MAITRTNQRTEREELSIHASRRQADLIRAAAAARGLTLSEFILDSVCRQAEEELLERRHFVLSEDQMKAFVEALDQPPQVLPRLRRLLSDPSVTERDT